MSKHALPTENRRRTRTVVAASFGVAALALTGAGVYAGLLADATGTQAVSSGTLKLIQAAAGTSTGFPTTISDMAPGDSRTVYVDVTDTGTIAAKDLSLRVAGSGATLLTTDATKGLQVRVASCSVAWVAGTCADVTLPLGAGTTVIDSAVADLSATPEALVTGAVAKNSAYHYKVVTSLPDQTETTTNGTLPANTIQNLSTTLTFTFNELQRDAIASNS